MEYNIRGVLHAFFRQKWKFIIIFGLFAFTGWHYISNANPVYQARGSFLIRFGESAKPGVNMPGGNGPTEVSYNDRKEIMESHIRILQSHNLLQKVIFTLGVENIYPEMAKAAENTDIATQKTIAALIGGDLEIKPGGDSNMIEIFVKNEDPEIAARLTDRLMDMFVVRQAEIYDTAQTSFLEKQVEGMKAKLEQSRQALTKFKEEAGISGIDEEMTQLLREKSELSALAFQSVAEAKDALAVMEAKEAEMRATYKADSPVMKRLQDSIVVAEKELKERQSDLTQKNGDQVSSLSEKIKDIDARIAWLEEKRGSYNELEQRVAMDEENYKYYQQRGEEARINNLLNRENITRISIVDRPVTPSRPIGPRKKLILLAFLMAGTMLGLGLALVLEILDDRVTTPEQMAAYLGVPVLASFGKVRGA